VMQRIARVTPDDTGPNARARRPSLVSVVIPARNARRTLEAQLEALRAQDYAGPWELVVADNGSTDGTAELARSWARVLPLRIVDASARRGASYARNRGWRSARGDLMAFCDADDVVSSRWLSRLAEAAEQADLVGGPYEFRRLNAAQGQPWWDGASLPVKMSFLRFIVGGNLAVWADVLTALSGFNEAYTGEEDVELSWRAQLSSRRLSFAPEAVVHCRYRTRGIDIALQAYRTGYEEPHLYRDFRAHGVPRSTPWRFPLLVGSLLLHAPAFAMIPRRRLGGVRRAFMQLGRLAGCVRFRVLFL
jgi:glycosyltransferase involved in cell wall biosynthesis